jgi:hypothetical protein
MEALQLSLSVGTWFALIKGDLEHGVFTYCIHQVRTKTRP